MPRPPSFDRQAALDAAVGHFWSHTYAATSTEELCEATGLARSSLYNTFTSKAALYRESLTRYGEIKQDSRDVYVSTPGTGLEVVRRVAVDMLTEQFDTADRRGCLVINAAVEMGTSDDGVAAAARVNLTGFDDMLTDIVTRGQDDGSIRADRGARELAELVHAVINGLQVAARVASGRDEVLRSVDTMLAVLAPSEATSS
ncbi:TetR/AcrR family transcriptional regulator [Gordonia soli]|uniref:Putative transcriptional regulator n=1 Tax=Gordonia soli NBRC 108243 TaxID=1223545 RepID=M0QR90_9ACTN|nr:TetR/AcrR family transcriptional regulator [Gordonia soli]GAC70924.1 putative transcriptional regulator [Gordonia soli NBRC 108243]